MNSTRSDITSKLEVEQSVEIVIWDTDAVDYERPFSGI